MFLCFSLSESWIHRPANARMEISQRGTGKSERSCQGNPRFPIHPRVHISSSSHRAAEIRRLMEEAVASNLLNDDEWGILSLAADWFLLGLLWSGIALCLWWSDLTVLHAYVLLIVHTYMIRVIKSRSLHTFPMTSCIYIRVITHEMYQEFNLHLT